MAKTWKLETIAVSEAHKILTHSHVLFGKPASAFPGHALKGRAMPGKRIQIDEETWQQLNLLGHDQMKDFQELADEALRDLLKKYGRPVDLKDAAASQRPARPYRSPIALGYTQEAAAEVAAAFNVCVFGDAAYAYRSRARARAFAASISRFLAGLAVSSDCSNRRAVSVTSSTARLKAASLARDGFAKPLSLRTNCTAEARISSSLAGGSKLNSVRILRHIFTDPLAC